MSTTRKCLVKLNSYEEAKPATFHQWGSQLVYDDSNEPHTRTIAIVELESGQIEEVKPVDVRFTN